MRIAGDIERLVWDDWNRQHIQKHKVTVDEVEEAVAGRPLREVTYKGRPRLISSTVSGRKLTVIIGPVPGQAGSFYVFSARPASSRERLRNEQASGGTKT